MNYAPPPPPPPPRSGAAPPPPPPPPPPSERQRRSPWPPWWAFLIIAAVLGLGIVGSIFDDRASGDERKAAETIKTYLGSYADFDAQAFCSTLAPDSVKEVIDSTKAYPKAGDTCESNAAFQFDELDKLDDPRFDDLAGIDDVDVDDIADQVEIDGDTARIDGDSAFINESIVLERIGDEWLIAPQSFGGGTVKTNEEGSSEDAKDAADSLCASAFGERGPSIQELLKARREGDRSAFEAAKAEVVQVEDGLAYDLRQLAGTSDEPMIDDLLEAQADVVEAARTLAPDAKPFTTYIRAVQNFSSVATADDFHQVGCALPIPGGSAPGSLN